MKSTLSDVSRRSAWTPEQRSALRSAFQAIVDAFNGVVLVRGRRITATGTVSGGTLSLVVDCPFKPRSVMVACVTPDPANTSNTSVNYTGGFPLDWSWSSTPTGGAVTFEDMFSLFGAIGDGTYTFDIILEKTDG